jgi:hypothetical protein
MMKIEKKAHVHSVIHRGIYRNHDDKVCVCYLECDFFTQVAFNFEILAAYFAQENVL